MKIGKTIRQYRKQKNLTQEEIANYLGVTSTAVTKWESETSYPDITLLAPLARILGTDVDTLLSFHEEMTDEEVERLAKELTENIQKNGYEAAYQEAEKQICEYPNCSMLMYSLAQVLYLYLELQPEPVQKKCEKQILAWLDYVRQTGADQKLYEHMKFKPQEEYNWLLNITQTFFKQSEELDFLREEPEFLKLVEEL